MPLYFLLFADRSGTTGVLVYDPTDIAFTRAIPRTYRQIAVLRAYSVPAIPRTLAQAAIARPLSVAAIPRVYLNVAPREDEPTLDYTARSLQWIMTDEVNRPVICDVTNWLVASETLTAVTATVQKIAEGSTSGTDVTGSLLQGTPGYSGAIVSCNIGNANAVVGFYYVVRFHITTSNSRVFSVIQPQIHCYD